MRSNEYTPFLKSMLTMDNPFNSTEEVLGWIRHRNNSVHVKVEQVLFKDLHDWHFDKETYSLKHNSGKFFSIEGIHVTTNWGHISEWEQPIINQPEVGILGIITKEVNGVLYFLMQAKIEPGNVNSIQLSPTLQATKSNYTQVHKGKKPNYLDHFLNPKKVVLLDQLQSEQGARFLKKRNRNIIIKVNEDIPVYEDFCWLTLGQINELIQHDNVVNMDTRTVISGIPFGEVAHNTLTFFENFSHTDRVGYKMLESCLTLDKAMCSFDEIISWITHLKSKYDLLVTKKNLNQIDKWHIRENEIAHEGQKFFSVIPVNVTIENREVKSWNQPLIKPAQDGICALIIKEINGIYHFLVQAKLECGNHDIIELAPTVQCLTDNYRNRDVAVAPFLDYVLNADKTQIIYDTIQSEEGGRFYHEQNRNLMIIAEDFDIHDIPENYMWMTLYQLKTFLKFNNYLNIQFRSLISAIKFL